MPDNAVRSARTRIVVLAARLYAWAVKAGRS